MRISRLAFLYSVPIAVLGGLIGLGGAVVAAFYGLSLAHKPYDERLERVILVLLLAIGLALIVESVRDADFVQSSNRPEPLF